MPLLTVVEDATPRALTPARQKVPVDQTSPLPVCLCDHRAQETPADILSTFAKQLLQSEAEAEIAIRRNSATGAEDDSGEPAGGVGGSVLDQAANELGLQRHSLPPLPPAAATDSAPVVPEGWDVQHDHTGRPYYVDHNTHSTHWELPANSPMLPPPPPPAADPDQTRESSTPRGSYWYRMAAAAGKGLWNMSAILYSRPEPLPKSTLANPARPTPATDEQEELEDPSEDPGMIDATPQAVLQAPLAGLPAFMHELAAVHGLEAGSYYGTAESSSLSALCAVREAIVKKQVENPNKPP